MWLMPFRVTIALLGIMLVRATGQEIPAGKILPIILNNTLDSAHDRPGKVIKGRIMQDVVLPHITILEGALVMGHVVSSNSATTTSHSRLTVTFDRIAFSGRHIFVTTHLRALASMNEVFEATLPTNSFDDYGTSTSDWNTTKSAARESTAATDKWFRAIK